MSALAARLADIPELLTRAAARYRIPGASLAVLADGETFEAATGLVNRDSGVEATPDAVFQIGSITKVFTATLVLQLVEEGAVTLEAPVRQYLPGFVLGDAEAAGQITVRQLLTHTSGMDGDFFQDAGRGDDCVERYVLACAALPQLHPPGALFSYCNAGFVIAGRLVETLRGAPWDDVLRERILDPLGLDAMGSRAEEALRNRAAVGHVADPDGEPGALRVAHSLFLPRSNGPAGATPFARARELIRFARLHLEEGTLDGVRLLAPTSVAAMQARQLDVPAGAQADAWGLGWMLWDWGGERVIGHDGGTIGQAAYLRILPERKLAIALLTNGGNGAAFYRRVIGAVLGTLTGIGLPPLPAASGVTLDLAPYVGRYERLMQRCTVERADGRLILVSRQRRPLEGGTLEQRIALEAVNARTFVGHAPESRFETLWTFLDPHGTGRPTYLLGGGRVHPRIAS